MTGDDHYADFIGTVDFLEYPRQAGRPSSSRPRSASSAASVTGGDPQAAKDMVEALLRKVMCRTERPVSGIADMLIEKLDQPAAPTAEDLLGFVALKRIADEVGGALSVEYWKSAPYFLNFMDGYQLSEKFRQHDLDPWSRRALLEDAQVIRRADLRGTPRSSRPTPGFASSSPRPSTAGCGDCSGCRPRCRITSLRARTPRSIPPRDQATDLLQLGRGAYGDRVAPQLDRSAPHAGRRRRVTVRPDHAWHIGWRRDARRA